MPQNLTTAWKKDLGEDWEAIQEKYLHTIGNLTWINQGDNSEIKNKPFQDKLAFIKKQTHYSLSDYFKNNPLEKWGEAEITKRATAIFKIALELWQYQPSDFTPQIKDKEMKKVTFEEIDNYNDLTHKEIIGYQFLEGEKKVKNWRDFLENISRELLNANDSLFLSLIETQEIKGNKHKYLSNDQNDLAKPLKLKENVYIEGSSSTGEKLRLIANLMEKYQEDKNKLEIYLKEEN